MTNSSEFAEALVEELVEETPDQSVTVLVGENGGGKTRLLNQIASMLRGKGQKVLSIPAARIIRTANAVNPKNPSTPSIDDLLNNDHPGSELRLDNFLLQTCLAIRAEDAKKQTEFLLESGRWISNGKQPPEPIVPVDELPAFLKKIGEIVGHEIIFDLPHPPLFKEINPQLLFIQDDKRLPLNSLSNGERQILLFSIFLLREPNEKFYLLIDEPELHLNDARCVTLWEGIERALPNAVFLYATHSLLFATRSQVKNLISVERGDVTTRLDRDAAIPEATMRRIVGARMQLLRTDALPIFCEDDAHRMLIKDLFFNEKIEPVQVGNWEIVRSAVASDSAFKDLLSGRTRKCGLIDRDFHSSEALEGFERVGVFALPYNDSESVLLHPNVAKLFITSATSAAFDLEAYKEALCKAAEKALPESLQKISLQISQENPVKITYKLGNNGIEDIQSSSLSVAQDAFTLFSKKLYISQRNGDIESILRYFKGKLLYKHIKHPLGELGVELPKARQYHNLLRVKPHFADILLSINELKELRSKIMTFLHDQAA